MIQRYLVFWLCLSSAAAYFWPQIIGNWASQLPTWLQDPWVIYKPLLWGLISVTMFTIGYMLPRDEVRQVAQRWPTVLGGTLVQYTTMPLVAFVVGRLLQLEGDALIGLMIVGCVPGAMASNVLTLNARGNTSYSVSLTTSATILSPLVVPFTLWLTVGQTVVRDPIEISVTLALTVVLPVIAGHIVGRSLPRWDRWARPLATLIANLTILWIIAMVVGAKRELLGREALWYVIPLLLVNAGGYLAGYGGASAMRLPEPMRRALTLEVGMQNAGVGTALAVQFFPDNPAAPILPATYTFGCMLTGTILARLWAMASDRCAKKASS